MIYYAVGCLIHINFVILATHWRELVHNWESNEWILLQELNDNYSPKQVRRKAQLVLVTFFAIGSILQVLWQVTLYSNTTDCEGFQSQTHAFYSNSFPELFTLVPFSHVIAVLAYFTSLMCEYSHIYLNVFLITVCLGLREQFQILNERILKMPLTVSINRIFCVFFYFIRGNSL